jgi:hypothetical protein
MSPDFVLCRAGGFERRFRRLSRTGNVADWKTTPDERADAEKVIADAKLEARRRGHFPALSRTLAIDPEVHARCEIDENGRLFLPERWHGFKERDHNPT